MTAADIMTDAPAVVSGRNDYSRGFNDAFAHRAPRGWTQNYNDGFNDGVEARIETEYEKAWA